MYRRSFNNNDHLKYLLIFEREFIKNFTLICYFITF